MKDWRVEMRDSNTDWTPVKHKNGLWHYVYEGDRKAPIYALEDAISKAVCFYSLHSAAIHRNVKISLRIRFIHEKTGEIIPFEALGV